MSHKKLYERLVQKLHAHWGTVYLMQDWLDPESAVDTLFKEMLKLREENAKLRRVVFLETTEY